MLRGSLQDRSIGWAKRSLTLLTQPARDGCRFVFDFCLESRLSFYCQIEIRMHGIVRKNQGCFFGMPRATFWIELNYDFSLPTGRDYPIELGSSAASAGEHLLDLEGCRSDVLHDESVRILTAVGQLPEIEAHLGNLGLRTANLLGRGPNRPRRRGLGLRVRAVRKSQHTE